MNIEDDFTLIRQCLDGNTNSFEIIVKKYQLKIINLSYKYTKNYADAEEVAQQSFLRAFNSLDKFRFESQFSTWMHRITVNCALNYINSKEKMKEKETISIDSGHSSKREDFRNMEVQVPADVNAENPYNHYNMEELAGHTEKVYNSLPEELKLVIKLREIEGMSYDEISLKTGMPIGTVRSRLHRAREILIHSLKDYLPDE